MPIQTPSVLSKNGTVEVLEPVIAGCLDVLEQCQKLVQILTPEEYRQVPVGHSSIGAHVRHGIEHFTQVVKGMAHDLIDYDARERDLVLEQDPSVFPAVCESLSQVLRGIHSARLRAPLRILQAPGPNVPVLPIPSTLERELLFCSSHMMHHLAMMKLIAQLNGTFSTDSPRVAPQIGVAYSTLNHQSRLKAEGN
ncbi:MAG: hypothetical protein SFY68_04190 [Candidatus Sumerlaeia bacterium]|nr:hypothetical protein [Candidatus Sumerlaeia bacterium]